MGKDDAEEVQDLDPKVSESQDIDLESLSFNTSPSRREHLVGLVQQWIEIGHAKRAEMDAHYEQWETELRAQFEATLQGLRALWQRQRQTGDRKMADLIGDIETTNNTVEHLESDMANFTQRIEKFFQ
eukprot:TCALIF_05832-PA protein Name:"Protein of unknown function" AED:0.40 eAED:1.00 QI:0/-1/0/1/-1/1/1/0/127